jgi:hypothetical protein
VLAVDRHETPVGPHAGIDDGEHDRRLREVLDRADERERAGADVVGWQLVREIDDRRAGCLGDDDALADADELVREAVVREERDDAGRDRC